VTNEDFVPFLNAKGNQKEDLAPWVNLEGNDGVPCGIKKLNGKFMVKPGYEKLPIIHVSWYGARAYAAWLKSTTGKNYRLPSEAEWEYAARGGQKSKGYKYAGSDNLQEVAWCPGNADKQPHKVGSILKSNELGLYDMSGNVNEWIADCYHDNYNGAPTDGSAWADENCGINMFRGGSWAYNAKYCQTFSRHRTTPYSGDNDLGFRIVHSQ